MIRETAQRISDEWREALRQVGVSGTCCTNMKPPS